MSPSARALLWETWQIGAREMYTRAGVLLATASLLATGVLQRNVGEGPAEQVIRSVVILIVMEVCIASSLAWRALDLTSQVGFGSLFVRPVTTRCIVAVRFGYTVGINVALYVLAGVVLQQVFSPDFPVAGGAAVVALCSAIFTCLLWSPATMAGRGAGAILGLICIFLVFAALNVRSPLNQPFVMAAGAPGFFRLDFPLAITAIVGVLVAFTVASKSIAVQRGGDMLGIERWLGGWLQWFWSTLVRQKFSARRSQAAEPGARRLEPFSSAKRAQYWCEFRTHGYPVAVVASIIGGIGLLLLGGAVLVTPATRIDFLWFVALFLSPFAFQLISADGASNIKASDGIATYSPFFGTRPLSNQQLVRIKLISIALHTTMGFLIVLAAAALHFSIFGWARIEGVWPALARLYENTSVLWWLVAFVTFVWTYVSSSGQTLSIGYFITLHPKQFWFIAGAMYLHAIPALLLAGEGWPYVEIWSYYVYLLAIVVLAIGMRSVTRSFKDGQLSLQSLAIGTGLWAAYMCGVAFVCKESGGLESLPTAIVVLAGSLLTVPLVGLLTVAASLAQNRHA